MPNIIQLSDNLIIGKGRDRICFEHPSISNQCIKISIKSNKQSRREARYFNFLKKKQADLTKVSMHLGRVNTNKGTGYTFELIRDHDGAVSRTLRDLLESRTIAIYDIQPKLLELKEYLIANRICARDISPSNICCQYTQDGINLFIIDGISNSNINPLTVRLHTLTNASIKKAWKGLERKLARIEVSLKKAECNENLKI